MTNNESIGIFTFCFVAIFVGIGISKAAVNHDVKCDEENFIKVQRQRGEGYSLVGIGDYSKLKLIVRFEERKSAIASLIFLHFYLKNESDGEVLLSASTIGGINTFIQNLSVSIVDQAGNPVEKTRYGEYRFPFQFRPPEAGDFNAPFIRVRSVFGKLQPGKELKIYSPERPLCHYFDLSRPGQYQLTAHLHRNFIAFDPPLESEPLSFCVYSTNVLNSTSLSMSKSACGIHHRQIKVNLI